MFWGVLNRSMITSGLLMTSNKLIFCRLLKYKTVSLENDRKVETSPEITPDFATMRMLVISKEQSVMYSIQLYTVIDIQ